MPLPEGISEMTFAGVLGGRRFRYLMMMVIASAPMPILLSLEKYILERTNQKVHLAIT
jgi:3-polyprenyl-4-hydroxybenzoate decarboxylase